MRSLVRSKATSGDRAWAFSAALVALASVVGCGRDGPDLAPLSGRVSLDGQPLEYGLVQFVPESGTGPAAVGSIAGGRFVAETAGRSGAIPGRYRVRIEARAPATDETDTLPKSLIPSRYETPTTSGLLYDVVAGQENDFDITLQGSR